MKLFGQAFKMVSEWKYVGVVLSGTFCIKCDVDRAPDSFLKQINSLFSELSYADGNVSKLYTSSLYAVENRTFGASNRALHKLSMLIIRLLSAYVE